MRLYVIAAVAAAGVGALVALWWFLVRPTAYRGEG